MGEVGSPGSTRPAQAAGVNDVASVVATAPSVEAALAAGVSPAELAATLDPAALRRMTPGLSPADADDIARLLGDPRVHDMFTQLVESPPANEPTLAADLIKQLSCLPDVARVVSRDPELMTALVARPVTLHHLAKYGRAVTALTEVLDDIEARGPQAVIGGLTDIKPTVLTEDQLAISERLAARVSGAKTQPDFDPTRIDDQAYQAEYLDGLYQSAEQAQEEVTALAIRVARQGEAGGGIPGWRENPKDKGRAWQKIAGYEGNVSRLKDLAGAKVEFDSLDDLYAALDRLGADGSLSIVEFNDRFIEPENSGYRDVQLQLRTSNGHVAEFRLHLRAMDEVAKWEHSLYEVRRDLRAGAAVAGRPMTAMEESIEKGLLELERQLFWQALQSSSSGR